MAQSRRSRIYDKLPLGTVAGTALALGVAGVLGACGDKDKKPSKPTAAQIAERKAARKSLDNQAKLTAKTVLRIAQNPEIQVKPQGSNAANNNALIREEIDTATTQATVNGKLNTDQLKALYPQQPQISVTYNPRNHLVAISAGRVNGVTKEMNQSGQSPMMSTDVVLELKRGADVKAQNGNLDLKELSSEIKDADVVAATASVDKEFPNPNLDSTAANGVYFSENGVIAGSDVTYIAVPSDIVPNPTYSVPSSTEEVTGALDSTANALSVAVSGIEQPLQP